MGPHEELEIALRRVAEPILATLGVELVDIGIRGGAAKRVVRLDIDRAGVRGVDIDDCQRVNRAVGIALDRADLFAEPYVLEVSSPGIDRPLRSADDFRRNTGRTVVVTARDDGGVERSHRGTLLGYDADVLHLAAVGAETLHIPAARIVRARQDVIS